MVFDLEPSPQISQYSNICCASPIFLHIIDRIYFNIVLNINIHKEFAKFLCPAWLSYMILWILRLHEYCCLVILILNKAVFIYWIIILKFSPSPSCLQIVLIFYFKFLLPYIAFTISHPLMAIFKFLTDKFHPPPVFSNNKIHWP